MSKTILITGGATGIGRACAYAFAEKDNNLIICYNKSEKQAIELARNLQNKCNIETIKIDLSQPDEIAKMFNLIEKKYKKLDILINNAGISFEKLLIDCSLEDINNLINVNLKAPILCSQEACKMMLPERRGNIINISSIYGVTGASTETIYSSAKAGIIAFTKALAKEMGDANIRINAIAPGAVDTPMNINFAKDKKAQEIFFENSAIKRMAKPEEIANIAKFLASDDSSYITGQVIIADGGLI